MLWFVYFVKICNIFFFQVLMLKDELKNAHLQENGQFFFHFKTLRSSVLEWYGGIFRTYIVLLFISCARLFLFHRSFFLFYYLVRTTFLFRRSFFLFYYLVRTTFKFRRSFFLLYYLVRTTFIYFVCRFFFSTISCARHFFYFVGRFFFFTISCARLYISKGAP